MGRIMNWIRSVTTRMFGLHNDFYAKAGIPSNIITGDMVEAIEQWCNLYAGYAPWLAKDPKTLGLPARIASEIAMMVTLEMQMNINDKKATGNASDGSATRAEYLRTQLGKVLENIQTNTEYACAKGGLVFKPYPDGSGISVDYVQADDFYPCAYNSKGEITGAVFLARKKVNATHYTRVEKHVLEGNQYTITNQCFKSMTDVDVGERCPLAEVLEWEAIDEEVTINNIDQPLFSYFRIPIGNTIDPKSPLGVSVFARAHQNMLLREADWQFQRLMWEYEGGELAIDASKDAFKTKGGQPELPRGKERLYRMNTIDSTNAPDELMKIFSPTLRDQSYSAGLQTVLKQIEDVCCLSRGTISAVEKEVRTATEIKQARQRTYATVTSIQKALEKALTGLVKASDYLATLYGLAPEGEYDLQFVWDDSVVTDAETERQHDIDEISAGIMQKWEYRVKWYGEDEETAKAMVAKEHSDDDLMGFGLPQKRPVASRTDSEGKGEGGEQ